MCDGCAPRCPNRSGADLTSNEQRHFRQPVAEFIQRELLRCWDVPRPGDQSTAYPHVSRPEIERPRAKAALLVRLFDPPSTCKTTVVGHGTSMLHTSGSEVRAATVVDLLCALVRALLALCRDVSAFQVAKTATQQLVIATRAVRPRVFGVPSSKLPTVAQCRAWTLLKSRSSAPARLQSI